MTAHEAARPGTCRVCVIAAGPRALPRLLRAYPAGHFDGSYVIGLWSGASVGAHMPDYLVFGALDEIWVAGEDARVRLASVAPIPVRHVKLPARPLAARDEARSVLGLAPDRTAIMLEGADLPADLPALIGAVASSDALLLIRAHPGSMDRVRSAVGLSPHLRVAVDQGRFDHGSLILGASDALLATPSLSVDLLDARAHHLPVLAPRAADIVAFLRAGPPSERPHASSDTGTPAGELLAMLGLDRSAPAFTALLGRSKNASLPVPHCEQAGALSRNLPVISVLMDGRAASRADVVRLAAELARGRHPFWELCVAGLTGVGRNALPPDPRIRLSVAPRPACLAETLNLAASIATGTHLAVARSLAEAAALAGKLAAIAAGLTARPEHDLVLAGGPLSIDRIESTSRSIRPVAVSRAAFDEAGGFQNRHDPATEYDLVLALSRTRLGFCEADCAPVRDPDAPAVDEAARLALGRHLRATAGPLTYVEAGLLPGNWRRRTHRACLPATTVIVSPGSAVSASELPPSATIARLRLTADPAAFTTEHLVFVDKRIASLAPDALASLLDYADEAEIGAVGGRVLNADTTLHHAGLTLRDDGTLEPTDPDRSLTVQNPDAVGGVLAIRRSVLLAAGGFDPALLAAKGATFDLSVADLCLRVADRLSLRIVYTPFAVFTRAPTRPGLDERRPRLAADLLFARSWSR